MKHKMQVVLNVEFDDEGIIVVDDPDIADLIKEAGGQKEFLENYVKVSIQDTFEGEEEVWDFFTKCCHLTDEPLVELAE